MVERALPASGHVRCNVQFSPVRHRPARAQEEKGGRRKRRKERGKERGKGEGPEKWAGVAKIDGGVQGGRSPRIFFRYG